MRIRRRSTLALGLLACAWTGAQAGGSLGIPDTINGYPTNVALVILGHSTSAQGSYPAKLVTALNHASHTLDGRHYVQFSAITPSDGGLLWSLVSAAPGGLHYHHLTASQGPEESANPQWCQDAGAVRWSCRRGRVEHLLTGVFPIPAGGNCAAAVSTCQQPATMACTWYDRTRPLAENPVTQSLTPHACLQRMDYRIALVQDTSNRSWPVDDYNASGNLDAADRWPATRILARALPCPSSSGVVGGSVDANCDQVLDARDSPLTTVAGWLAQLATDLRDRQRYGALAMDAVLVSMKPVEMGQCVLWPAAERPLCAGNPHAVRTPAQIASTPDRPYDHYYVPSVYWESRVLETLFDGSVALDAGILPTAPAAPRRLWDTTAQCYVQGLADADFALPAAVPGRPLLVAADDSETDAGGAPDSATVGCMIQDHVHHNDAGGWLIADHWYRGLAGPLWAGLPEAVFGDGFE